MMKYTFNRVSSSAYCRNLSSGIAIATGSDHPVCFPSNQTKIICDTKSQSLDASNGSSFKSVTAAKIPDRHSRVFPFLSSSSSRIRGRFFSTTTKDSEDVNSGYANTKTEPIQDVAAARGAYTAGGSKSQKVTVVKKTDAELMHEIKTLLRKRRVVLFMKGSPEQPECGFSMKAVQMLIEIGCSDFTYVDVMRSERTRELVKKLSGWPTIPQLFIGGKFVGGCDVMIELVKTGELRELLAKHGAVFKEEEEVNKDVNKDLNKDEEGKSSEKK